MKPLTELTVHASLLGVGAILAFAVWSGSGEDKTVKDGLVVEVWGGKAAEIERIEWEGKKRVVLEARSDKAGRYFVGTVEKQVQVLQPNEEKTEGDTESQQQPQQETVRFVAVKAVEELAKTLAPLKAYRALGAFDEARKQEFGFEELEGTLKVTIGGAQRVLEVGGTTPGGGDRYAREPSTNRLYAVTGDLVRSLSFAESRLFERELHLFTDEDFDGLRIQRGDAVRQLVRVKEKQGTWADAGSPETADETAGNWVSKVSQLRPTEYVETLPVELGPDSVVLRVEYLDGRRPRGYLELYRASLKGEEDDYLVRTEHTRWPAKVLRNTGEQVEQDLASVLR